MVWRWWRENDCRTFKTIVMPVIDICFTKFNTFGDFTSLLLPTRSSVLKSFFFPVLSFFRLALRYWPREVAVVTTGKLRQQTVLWAHPYACRRAANTYRILLSKLIVHYGTLWYIRWPNKTRVPRIAAVCYTSVTDFISVSTRPSEG
jgi:hypothetical protein